MNPGPLDPQPDLQLATISGRSASPPATSQDWLVCPHFWPLVSARTGPHHRHVTRDRLVPNTETSNRSRNAAGSRSAMYWRPVPAETAVRALDVSTGGDRQVSIRPAENSTLTSATSSVSTLESRRDLWLDVVTELPDQACELGVAIQSRTRKLGPLLDGTNAVEPFEPIDDKLAAEALDAMDPSLAATFLEALDLTTPPNILRESGRAQAGGALTLATAGAGDGAMWLR